MKRKLAILVSLLVAVATSPLQAANYDYAGPQTTSGNTWTTTTNWTPNGNPGATGSGNTDVANLNNVTANTTLTYNGSGFLGTLNFTQTTAGVTNALDLASSLKVTNALTVGATAGTSEIILESGQTLTDTAGITIGSGGELALASAATGGTVSAPLTINSGGTFAFLGTAGTLAVNGNFTLNGTAIGTTGEKGLNLSGQTNVIAATNTTSFNAVSLFGTGTTNNVSTLNTNSQLVGTTILRNSGNAILNISSSATGAQMASISMLQQTANAVTTLQLGSNLSISGVISAANFSQASTGTAGLTIDLNGHTLDTSTFGTATFAPNVGQVFSGGQVNVATSWNYTSSTGTGTIKAKNFTLSGVTQVGGLGGVSVGNNVILQATGGASTVNDLGNSTGGTASGGTINASSTFLYSGAATAANAATLISNRTIGALQVQNGFLEINQSNLTTGGNVSVSNNGGLLLGSSIASIPSILTVSSGLSFSLNNATLDMKLGGNGINDGIVGNGGSGNGGNFLLTNGTINLLTSSLSGTFSYANSYAIFQDFDISGNIITGDTFEVNGVALNGYTANLSQTGILTFTAVPEPSTVAFLSIGTVLLAVSQLRRRRVSEPGL